MESIHIDQVKTFISEHLKDEFSLSELADAVGYSAFHLAREFKDAVQLSIMEYTRNQRTMAAAKEIESGRNICDIAMDYCFETHSGFAKAFGAIFGCTPKEYLDHSRKMKTVERGVTIMEHSKIVVRHICEDDMQDLWENVYSAMTPKQITNDKILYAIEAYKKREGFELVAEVDEKVVMALSLSRPTWIPLGFVWDNNFTLTGGNDDIIMRKLMDELKEQAKRLGISTLLSPQKANSESSKVMQSFGFQKAMESGDWEYLMMAI